MTPDAYPSVSIVAGEITALTRPATLGHMLKMHGGAMYITITAEVARQWIQELSKITEESE